MNHLDNINKFIEDLTTDKTIPADERNYMLADAKRIRMSVRGWIGITVQKPPRDIESFPAFEVLPENCICDPNMPPRKNCPVHGKAL